MRNALFLSLVALASIACGGPDAGSPGDSTPTFAASAADPGADGVAVHDPDVTSAQPITDRRLTHVLLVGRTSDGQTLTVAAVRDPQTGGVQHVMVNGPDGTMILDGRDAHMTMDGFAAGAQGFGSLEVGGARRIVFGLSFVRHGGLRGDLLFLEGTGTIGELDVTVVGVLADARPGQELFLGFAPDSAEGADDGFALVSSAGEVEIVLRDGVVGGALAPSFAITRIVAADVVDGVAGLRREVVEATANERTLQGSHQYHVESAD